MPHHAQRALARLPKINGPIKSIKVFRLNTPGSTDWLFTGKLRRGYIDPTHPATKLPLARLPKGIPNQNALFIRAIPIPILQQPENGAPPAPGRWDRKIEPWASRALKWVQGGMPTPFPAPPILASAGERINMSLQFTTAARPLNRASKTLRLQLVHRVKSILNLIVTRDVKGVQTPNGDSLDFPDVPRNAAEWILPGWTYHIRMSPDLYIMPLSEAVNLVRQQLQSIRKQGLALEKEWARVACLEFQSDRASNTDSTVTTPVKDIPGTPPPKTLRGQSKVTSS
ncbi:hypothetical protein DL96DRAFT_934270 [Flagelloscypha sp. PMI_526]|nr:hypothetical protein DL96DRAFT_934270 [Flagelloscypha sp. PMI_526]